MKHCALKIIIIMIGCIPITATPATVCVENGLNRYYDAIKQPFEDIEEPDTSGLSACASAIAALTSISASISLATINLGQILSAIISAFISGVCEYIDGEVRNLNNNIQVVVNQANQSMQQFINEREQRIDQINRSNLDRYIDFQIEVNNSQNPPQ